MWESLRVERSQFADGSRTARIISRRLSCSCACAVVFDFYDGISSSRSCEPTDKIRKANYLDLENIGLPAKTRRWISKSFSRNPSTSLVRPSITRYLIGQVSRICNAVLSIWRLICSKLSNVIFVLALLTRSYNEKNTRKSGC